MPKNPGRKSGVPSTAGRSSPMLAIKGRVKLLHSQNSIPNVNPFRLRQLNFRIKVCQGCRGSLPSILGTVTDTTFDFLCSGNNPLPGVESQVVSSTESESKKSERFNFSRFRVTLSLTI